MGNTLSFISYEECTCATLDHRWHSYSIEDLKTIPWDNYAIYGTIYYGKTGNKHCGLIAKCSQSGFTITVYLVNCQYVSSFVISDTIAEV